MNRKGKKIDIVGLKELRENTEKYIREVDKGRSFTVLRRSRPIFTISPPEGGDVWESAVDFTKLDKKGVSATDVLKVIRKMDA